MLITYLTGQFVILVQYYQNITNIINRLQNNKYSPKLCDDYSTQTQNHQKPNNTPLAVSLPQPSTHSHQLSSQKPQTDIFYQTPLTLTPFSHSLQNMLKSILVSLFLLCIVSPICEPFGRRIFYGNAIRDPKIEEKLVVRFNTKQPCNASYVTIVQSGKLLKVRCESVAIEASADMNNYKSYVQVCRTDDISYEDQFYYNTFGWDGSAATPSGGAQFTKAKLVYPHNTAKKIKLIMLGDWSYIEKDPIKVKPIKDLLLQTQAKHQINGLVILGDIVYNLDSQNGVKYEKFLHLVSETIPGIPMIVITGNHQHGSEDCWLLATHSFEHYGRDVEMAVSLSLGNLNLVPFDPYDVMYQKVTPKQDSTIKKFREVLSETRSKGKLVLPCSHYPYRCSGPGHCLEDNQAAIKPYFDAMLDNGVSLYMSGHEHLYQRMYPYLRNGSFLTQMKSDYRTDGGYLIAVIQGIAGGSDGGIVDHIDKIQSFTNTYSIGQTGIGVLEIDTQRLSYTHISSVSGIRDYFQIQLSSALTRQ